MVASAKEKDPSYVGYYLGDAYYERAIEVSREWREIGEIPAERVPDADTQAACERLIFAEARLVDDDRLEEWLDLFVPELLYWIPSTREAPDPRVNVALEIHDRRRLEEHVARLRTGFAYSQHPPTRTRHLYTNLEMWQATEDSVHARVNANIATYLKGNRRALVGWIGFVLRRLDGQWQIEMKQINYLDPEYGQENNSFTV
jgi:3-phenylpropionate/cinnamic acid dioxygenase small subunit